jgi:hypothetical protein
VQKKEEKVKKKGKKKEKSGKKEKVKKKENKHEKVKKKKINALWITVVIHSALGVGEL